MTKHLELHSNKLQLHLLQPQLFVTLLKHSLPTSNNHSSLTHHTYTAKMSAEGVQNPGATEQAGGADTTMESFDKGKGKAQAEDAMDEDDSSEDDEVRAGNIHATVVEF